MAGAGVCGTASVREILCGGLPKTTVCRRNPSVMRIKFDLYAVYMLAKDSIYLVQYPQSQFLGLCTRSSLEIQSRKSLNTHGVSTASILRINRIKSPRRLRAGTQLLISNQGNEGFLCPLRVRSYVTSSYGYRRHPISRKMKFHHGIDLGVRPRTPVYAARSGKVIRAGWYGGYGNLVVIKHDDDYITRYGHLSKIRVKVGQRVTPQQIIGLSGSSGHATGSSSPL